MDDLDALNLILKANKEMLKSETARADKAEQQRDAGGLEWLPSLPAANDTIAKMKGGA